MMEVLSNQSIVNKLLYNKTLAYRNYLIDSQLALLIHNSLLPDILEHMNNQFGVDFKYDSRPYTLHVGETSFDMTLIFVTVKSTYLIDFITYHVVFGQFSKIWEYYLYRRKTLYIDLDRYHVFKKFIEMHNLGKSIIDIVVEPGINTKQNHIKIVTFSEEVDYLDLVQIFNQFSEIELLETDNNRHYYINFAFNWLQPTRLSQLNNKPLVNERFFFGLHTFLDCLREDTLNILQLCSMKLAFCELSLTSSCTARFADRIDYMITTLLKKAECDRYIQDGEFDFHGYAEKHNINLNNIVLCGYFLYTFQNHFQSIKLDSSIWSIQSIKEITLIDPQDLLLELRGNPNIIFIINAINFSEMDAKLFFTILQCASIHFSQITLTSSVLEELMEWNFYENHMINFSNAKIANDVHTWLLFIRLIFNSARFIEEEATWQYLFDGIVLHINQLRNGAEFGADLQFNEFVFKNNCEIITLNGKEIDLSKLKFTIDESNTKLEIKDKFSNRQIDLFDLKNGLDFSPEEEDGSCYEFYQ